MAWRGQAALARPTPTRRRVPRLADHTGLSIFLRERKGSSPWCSPRRRASGGGPRRLTGYVPRERRTAIGVPRGTPHARIVTRMGVRRCGAEKKGVFE